MYRGGVSMNMETIVRLEEERDKICLQKLVGIEPDFSEMRSICKILQEKTEYNFKVDDTDEQLLESVILFFRDILKASI